MIFVKKRAIVCLVTAAVILGGCGYGEDVESSASPVNHHDSQSHRISLAPRSYSYPVLPLQQYSRLEDVFMTAGEYADGQITVTIVNNSAYNIITGLRFALEFFDGETWVSVPQYEAKVFFDGHTCFF